MPRVADALPGISLTLAGELVDSETTLATVSAYVVVLASVVPRLAVTLTSTYLGQIDGDTAASHLRLLPDAALPLTSSHASPLSQHVLPGAQPGSTHLRLCLLDHVAELQQLLGDLTRGVVAIDIAATTFDLQWGV
jgi:hypothetical protein